MGKIIQKYGITLRRGNHPQGKTRIILATRSCPNGAIIIDADSISDALNQIFIILDGLKRRG